MHRSHRSGPAIAGCLTLIVALVAAGTRAQAAPKTREQREADARKACAAGRVEAGIEVLAELLTEYSHPNYIYNQGRCYQQNGRAEQAISRFKEYLRAAQDISADERERVERFIKELEAEVQASAPSVPPPPPPVTGTETPPPPVAGEPSAKPAATPPPVELSRKPPPERSGTLRTAAIALGVVGLAGVATGVVSTLQVRSLETEVETARIGQFNGVKLSQQQEKARRFETLQWIGYGVGAAAVAGAVVCLIMDSGAPAAEASRGVRLAGTIGPDGQPRLVLSGRF
jgi:hypothetical protein